MNPLRLPLHDIPPEQRRILEALRGCHNGELAVEFEDQHCKVVWVKLVSTERFFGLPEGELQWLDAPRVGSLWDYGIYHRRHDHRPFKYVYFPEFYPTVGRYQSQEPNLPFAVLPDLKPGTQPVYMPGATLWQSGVKLSKILEQETPGQTRERVITEVDEQAGTVTIGEPRKANDPAFAQRGVCSYCGGINLVHTDVCIYHPFEPYQPPPSAPKTTMKIDYNSDGSVTVWYGPGHEKAQELRAMLTPEVPSIDTEGQDDND